MTTRKRHSRRDSRRRIPCTFCGSTERVEAHHVGGRNHAPETLPLCQPHHRDITRALHAAGIDMRATRDPLERIARALKALAVFLYRLAEELMKGRTR